MPQLVVTCPHCNKEIERKELMSFAEVRRIEKLFSQKVIEKHIRLGYCIVKKENEHDTE